MMDTAQSRVAADERKMQCDLQWLGIAAIVRMAQAIDVPTVRRMVRSIEHDDAFGGFTNPTAWQHTEGVKKTRGEILRRILVLCEGLGDLCAQDAEVMTTLHAVFPQGLPPDPVWPGEESRNSKGAENSKVLNAEVGPTPSGPSDLRVEPGPSAASAPSALNSGGGA